MRRSINALAAVAVLALTLAGCASGKDTGLPAGPTTAPPGKVCSGEVDMVNLTFEPQDCTVPVGTTVKWINKVGGLPHTVTSEDGKFDSKTVNANGEFSFTFKTAGDYPYFCQLHASKGARAPGSMIGTIKVEASSGGGSPSPTSS
jgi:plastocyanin